MHYTLPAFRDFSFNCSPLHRFVERVERGNSFSAHNIEKIGSDTYRITLSVPGFRKQELSVAVHGNVLTVKGERENSENLENKSEQSEYLYQGFNQENFEKSFQIGNFFIVKQVALDNGLLTIKMVREIPEEKKPKIIEIQSLNEEGKLIQGKNLLQEESPLQE